MTKQEQIKYLKKYNDDTNDQDHKEYMSRSNYKKLCEFYEGMDYGEILRPLDEDFEVVDV